MEEDVKNALGNKEEEKEVTDEDLLKALEYSDEDEKEKTLPKEEENIKDEPEDNLERTKLGRKVKSLEDKLETILQEIRNMKSPKKEEEPAEEQDSFPELVSTPTDVIKVIQKYQSETEKKIEQYRQRYRSKLASFAEIPEFEDIHKEVVKAMYTNPEFDKVYSRFTDPEKDCETNYTRAAMFILKQRAGKKENPFKGRSSAGATEPPTKRTGDGKEFVMPELDADAAELAAMMSEEDVIEALSSKKKYKGG